METPLNATIGVTRNVFATVSALSSSFSSIAADKSIGYGSTPNYLIIDQTNSSLKRQPNSVEVLPVWRESIKTWTWVWSVHRYGIATLFLILTTYALFSILILCRKYKTRKYLTLILVLLYFTGLEKGVFYIIDPYSFHQIVPALVNRLLFEFSKPTLVTSYACLQIMVLRLTQLDVGTNLVHAPPFVAIMFVLQLILTTTIESVVTKCRGINALLLLNNGVHIVWSVFLCVTFIYNGFQLTHYTSEVQKALKELVIFSQHRRSESVEGMSRSSTFCQRLNKPRIRITNKRNKTCSIVTDSDDSDTDCNGLCLPQDDTYRDTNMISNQVINARQHLMNENAIDTPSKCTDSVRKRRLKNRRSKLSRLCANSNAFAFKEKFRNFLRLDSNEALLNECRQTLSRDTSQNINTVYRQNLTQTTSFNELTNVTRDDDLPESSDLDDDIYKSNTYDAGYMADTESAKYKRKHEITSSIQTETTYNAKVFTRIPETEYDLPNTASTISLHRIRQSKMLQVVICYGYAATFVGFVMCLLELYTIFSSYGILGGTSSPHPWPWIAFQTFKRLVEFAMCLAISMATYEVIKYRLQRRLARRTRLKMGDRKCSS